MSGPIKKILVYLDGSEQSVTSAQYAVCLAKSQGAELFGIYVVNVKALNDLVKAKIFLPAEQQEYQQDLEADAERYLKHFRGLALKKGLETVTSKTSGAVYTEVRNYIKENDIDILIIGELSNTRSRRDEFYSEAERTVRTVECSVLIVKDEEHVWDMYENLV